MAGMADFYLRFGDKLQQGIGQIAGVGDQLLQADQRNQDAQNELAKFIERRAAARRQERQDAFAEMDRSRRIEQEDKDRERADQQYQRSIDFMKWVAEQEGKGVDRDIAMREALGRGLLQPKDYLELTKPKEATPRPETWETVKTDKGYVQVNQATGQTRPLGINAPASEERPDSYQIAEVNGRKVKVNMRTGEQQDLGPITPKVSPKASENIKNKLQTLNLAKQQIEKIKQSWEKAKGPLSTGPKFLGQGLIPSESGKTFDADIDAFRQTLRQLTRTPGEGAMSDFETRLAQAALPSRGNYESVTQRQIDNLEDMIALLESGYTGMQSDFERPSAETMAQPPSSGQVQEWIRDPATGKLRRK